MPKYMFQASYTAEGIKGVLKEGGTGRREALSTAVSKLGGRLESFYYALGEHDVFAVFDAPDNVTAVALSASIAATGAINVRTTVLLTVEEIDQAGKMALTYRAPGH
ncbi:MAG TPA: GYD domain-containing protein [Candidatus Sulfotelmatobacter sp.]|nr:GYD domain-containing protein [Candidatus Sulfotelmatobacter sp.]